MTNLPTSYTGPLLAADATICKELGTLMTQVSSSYDGSLINAQDLDFVIHSPHHAQLIAVRRGHIVGAGSLSLLPCSYDTNGTLTSDPTVWLGSFIVDADHRGRLPDEPTSIASQLWKEMVEWTRSQGISSLQFMTEPNRGAAIQFYKSKHALEVGKAMLFNVPVASESTINPTILACSIALVYETCKTFLSLHLLNSSETITKEMIDVHIQTAQQYGIPLMQYIAPSGTSAHDSLINAGLSPRREEMIMRVEV